MAQVKIRWNVLLGLPFILQRLINTGHLSGTRSTLASKRWSASLALQPVLSDGSGDFFAPRENLADLLVVEGPVDQTFQFVTAGAEQTGLLDHGLQSLDFIIRNRRFPDNPALIGEYCVDRLLVH
ncbi:MAG: hypothetical protein ACYDGS_02980 [Thermoleophilia bacterium]